MAKTFSTATALPVNDTKTRPINGITVESVRLSTAQVMCQRDIPETVQVIIQFSLKVAAKASENIRPR